MLCQMTFQLFWLLEGLSTLWTRKGIFTRVRQFVFFQIYFLSKCFFTLIAWKRFLVCVDRLMSFEIFWSLEKFVTHTAVEGKVFSTLAKNFSSVFHLVTP